MSEQHIRAMVGPPVMIQCPECPVELEEADFEGQALHMLTQHPEVVTERLAESHRWDGWEND